MQPEFILLTPDEARTRRCNFLYACYLGFITLYTLGFSVLMTRANSSYIIGDWLINYSGGFVRRGLIGEVILAVSHATHFQLRWVLFPIQVGAFVLFTFCVYRLSRGIRWTFLMTAIMVSPATVAFTVLDSYAGVRKETLLYASLAMVLCILVYGQWTDGMLSALLTVLVVGLVLSHEALAVGTPYFAAAVLIQTGSVRRTLKICAVPLIAGVCALTAVILHPGNKAIAEAVCSSVGGKLVPFSVPSTDICNGAIQWLEISLPEAKALNFPIIRATHMVRLFSVLVFPVLAPSIAQLVLLYRRDRLRREVWVVAGFGFISMLGTAVLFYTARDWGRWLHMQAVCSMLVIMLIDRRGAPMAELRVAPVWRSVWMRAGASVAVFLYATVWMLPSIGDHGIYNGYVHVVHMFRHWVPTPVVSAEGSGAARATGVPTSASSL